MVSAQQQKLVIPNLPAVYTISPSVISSRKRDSGYLSLMWGCNESFSVSLSAHFEMAPLMSCELGIQMHKPYLQNQGSVSSPGSLTHPVINIDFFLSCVTHSPGSHVTDMPAEYLKHAPVARNRTANFESTGTLQVSVSNIPQGNEYL